MTATFLVGDVHERQAELIAAGEKFDLVICSPPFLALRSYLPDDHPQKHLEIGSEQTPAEYLDVLLALTAEWRRLLAPHGSIAIELGDTYAGSGGAGVDYNPDGWRMDQQRFPGSGSKHRMEPPRPGTNSRLAAGNGWPLDKSLTGIPTLYTWSLAYGRNLLTGQPSPAGQWRIRNLKPWIRTNPPVGALGDKERPATSYITVATLARDRWFDLDAVRTSPSRPREGVTRHKIKEGGDEPLINRGSKLGEFEVNNPAGAPPLDWWHQVDAIIDNELRERAGKTAGNGWKSAGKPIGESARRRLDAANSGGVGHGNQYNEGTVSVGARGHHIRRALERAGILTTLDALDIPPKGYAGAHYAVFPMELVRQLVDEMCPRRVCTVCGEPSRRIVKQTNEEYTRLAALTATVPSTSRDTAKARILPYNPESTAEVRRAKSLIQNEVVKPERTTVGWSDCGCENCTCNGHDHRGAVTRCKFCPCDLVDHWRPGRILDPFVGSGTTFAVATGMARDAVGIDLDARNAHLAEQRVGMFLEIDWGHLEPTTELPPAEIVEQVEDQPTNRLPHNRFRVGYKPVERSGRPLAKDYAPGYPTPGEVVVNDELL